MVDFASLSSFNVVSCLLLVLAKYFFRRSLTVSWSQIICSLASYRFKVASSTLMALERNACSFRDSFSWEDNYALLKLTVMKTISYYRFLNVCRFSVDVAHTSLCVLCLCLWLCLILFGVKLVGEMMGTAAGGHSRPTEIRPYTLSSC